MRKRDPATAARRARGRGDQPSPDEGPVAVPVRIRRARASDIALVIDLDARITRIAKPDYWRDIFERYGSRRLDERFLLVAVADDAAAGGAPLLGYIIGEVRAWEFGSEPCGWVFAFSVDPRAREQHIGEQLFEAISREFRAAGVHIMRTMVARDNQLHLAFFRSEGMMAGRYIQLEKELD
jgi:ribosomal protein S18 acetylase RimI-like enzyme